ncbi:hypothetical protein [Nocardia nepalensis]|uniref:hypothetical protein n=1 Tax=Nocardia nepalensis TaxID=3375448 RepID=UPI003B670DC7
MSVEQQIPADHRVLRVSGGDVLLRRCFGVPRFEPLNGASRRGGMRREQPARLDRGVGKRQCHSATPLPALVAYYEVSGGLMCRTRRAIMRSSTAAVAAMAGLAIGLAATAPNAVADSVSPYTASTNGTVGPMWAQISTAPGGFIDFKFLLVGAVSGSCKLIAIPLEDVTLDGARTISGNPSLVMADVPVVGGFASGRLGPLPNGSYDIGAGTYCDGVDLSGWHHGARLLSTLPRDSSDHWTQVRVTLDGGGEVQAAPPPGQPSPLSDAPRVASELMTAYPELLKFDPAEAAEFLLDMAKNDFEGAAAKARDIERVAGPGVAGAAARVAEDNVGKAAVIAEWARAAGWVGVGMTIFDLLFNGPKAG